MTLQERIQALKDGKVLKVGKKTQYKVFGEEISVQIDLSGTWVDLYGLYTFEPLLDESLPCEIVKEESPSTGGEK